MLDVIASDLTRHKTANSWVTYLHELPDGNGGFMAFYAGVCRLSEVFNAPDATLNSEWVKFFEINPDAHFRLRVMNIEENENAAITNLLPIRRMFNPHCNAHGTFAGRNPRIQCLQTGVVYNNASEACRSLGLSQPALSNHLNGKPGYKTVKNYSFKKVT